MASSPSGEEGPKSSKKVFPIFEKNFRPKKPDPLQEIQETLDKCEQEQHQQAKRRKCLLGKKETAGLTQMILDAGQKTIGPIFCEECGLLYSPGDIEDEKEHRKAHSRLNNLYTVRLWKDPNVVLEFATENLLIVSVDCKSETRLVKTTLKDFLAWLDSELAGVDHNSTGQKSHKIFLCLFRTKRKGIFRVLGCAVVENLDMSSVLTSPLETHEGENENSNKDSGIVLGLTRLWTDTAFRKRKIASRLCDAIRISWSIPGMVLPKHQLGILEPSEDGKAFMIRYTNGTGRHYTYRYDNLESFV